MTDRHGSAEPPATLMEVLCRLFAMARVAADEAMQLRIRSGVTGGFCPEFVPPPDPPPPIP